MIHAPHSIPSRFLASLCLTSLLAFAPAAAYAQRAGVAIQQGPYYVGDPVLVRVTAENFEETPQPSCEPLNADAGITVKLANVSPPRRIVQIIKGRRTEHTDGKFSFDFLVTASEASTFRIGGFRVSQGAKTAQTNGVTIQVNQVELDPDMRILLNLPEGPIFPGQRVPVTLEWWYAGDLGTVSSVMIRAGLFDQFKFEDEPIRQGDTTIPVLSGTDTVQLKADLTRKQSEGRDYIVVSARRMLIADKPGTHELAPISVTVEKAIEWTRDVFGRRRASRTQRLRAVGEAQTLVVKSIPLNEAPPGYAGAVGQGFSIEVSADRTVVHAGDPIRLTFTLRGDGNLESAGLAPLGYVGGLDPGKFRSPESDATGIMNEDGRSKRFEVTVRVLDESVDQIPPVTYAWFDPERQQFHTARTSPIALQVLEAKIIGAQDVVESGVSPAQSESLDTPERPATPDEDTTGADLTLVTELSRLMTADAERFGGYVGQGALYGISVMIVLLAWWRRNVAEIDPAVLARRRLFKSQADQIQQASGQTRQNAARQIAAACRQLLPYTNDGHRPELDALIAECDALAFAPASGEEQRLDERLHRQAVELAGRIAREQS